MTNPENLIVVAGHAAFKDEIRSCPSHPQQDEHWVLQPFQLGEPPYYIEHIKSGIKLLQEDPRSLLVFSGGRTRKEAGHWSEATTYRVLAEHFSFWTDQPQQVMTRIALEEYARDSFQNLEYGLYCFYQSTGRYPHHISVVGWKFKADRFDLHRKALNIPAAAFTYIGVNDPVDLEGAVKGEACALEQFRLDPFGDRPPLADKRVERNPFNEVSPYDCPRIDYF